MDQEPVKKEEQRQAAPPTAETLHALMVNQLQKLHQQGWKPDVIARAVEMTYITLMASSAVQFDNPMVRQNFIYDRLRSAGAEVQEEVRLAILRRSVRGETKQ